MRLRPLSELMNAEREKREQERRQKAARGIAEQARLVEKASRESVRQATIEAVQHELYGAYTKLKKEKIPTNMSLEAVIPEDGRVVNARVRTRKITGWHMITTSTKRTSESSDGYTEYTHNEHMILSTNGDIYVDENNGAGARPRSLETFYDSPYKFGINEVRQGIARLMITAE